MKDNDIYDKQLQVIEEAEMKVRVAKHNLKEAERELDETLAFVEGELELNEVVGTNEQYQVFSKRPNSDKWEPVDENGRFEGDPPVYAFRDLAGDSDAYLYLKKNNLPRKVSKANGNANGRK